MKKLTVDDLKQFRTLMNIPISDGDIEKAPYDAPYYHPGADAPEIQYMLQRRKELGGCLPERRNSPRQLTCRTTDGRERRWAPAASLRPPWPSSG